MAIYWDDIEILRIVDERERGVRSGFFSGIDLMETIARERGVASTDEDYHSFVRELLAMADGGLLTWQVLSSLGRVREITPNDPNDYLQNIRDIALTVPRGRDRARGRIVVVPLPEPDEDDRRMIASLTLDDIANIIGSVYSLQQTIQFLRDAGVSLEQISAGEGSSDSPSIMSHVLAELEKGTGGQRRELREFLGAWLDDGLHSGPSPNQREKIVRDLARQGWFVRDGRLVIGEPVRGQDQRPPALSPDGLHETVWRAASGQWSAGHHTDAILEAAKAVNSMLQTKIDSHDLSEVQLVREAFSQNAAAPGKPRLRFPMIKDAKTRESMTQGALSFGVGCFQAIRNPVGHLPNAEHDLTQQEALERMAALSLLARWIEQADVETAAQP